MMMKANVASPITTKSSIHHVNITQKHLRTHI